MSKPRKGTNWETELRPEELMEKQNMKTVLLKGLRRLAEEAGMIGATCHIINPGPGIVQCVYISSFDDGTSWPGAGDCSPVNTSKPYCNYPTAVAESRAEARSLRKALNIQMLSSEEIDLVDAKELSPNKKIDSSVIVAIEQLCESKNVNKVDMLNTIIKDKQRANSIFELNQLTLEEGQKAMQYLNSLPEKKKGKK